MGKYENAKTLRLTKARVAHTCAKCGRAIEKGEMYYRESLGLMAKPPGMILQSFCRGCVEPIT